MKIRLYNHMFLNDDASWIFMFLDQMKQLEDFGLLDATEIVSITVLGNDKQFKLYDEISSLYPKIETHKIPYGITSEELKLFTHYKGNISYTGKEGQKDFVFEVPTMKRFWDDSHTQDFYGLYYHAKGATAFPNWFKNGDNIPKFKNYFYWKKFLEWGCIERWKDCVNALDAGNEVAGCNYNNHPVPHYSGNFFWFRSDYMKTLDDPSDSEWWRTSKPPYWLDRMLPEFWPLHEAKNIFNLHSPPDRLCSPNPGLYAETYERKIYEKS